MSWYHYCRLCSCIGHHWTECKTSLMQDDPEIQLVQLRMAMRRIAAGLAMGDILPSSAIAELRMLADEVVVPSDEQAHVAQGFPTNREPRS